jgi:ABC-type phosphate transport system substrate-binding protein
MVVVVAVLSIATVGMASAQMSIVISKASTHALTKEAARGVFAGGTVTWENGNKIQVIDQSDTEVGKTFYADFVGKSPNQVRLQWTKLVLSGQAVAPKKFGDDESVRKAVAADPNAIGFIQSSALDGSVKEIARIQ